MIKFDKLDLTKCKTNKDVKELLAARMKEAKLEDVIDEVNTKFVNHEGTVRAICTGIILGMNIYIHGRGGYGKTAITQHVLELLGIPYTTVSGYKDMPVEALLGVPNMGKFLNDSEYELNFSKSVFRYPGVLLGEEFGDILPATAASLKDILSAGGYRSTKFEESLIGCMIITTNKAPHEMYDDESKRAFYDSRFPIKHEVIWDTHKASDYFDMFSKTAVDEDMQKLYFLGSVLQKHNERTNDTVTPRKALEILEGFLQFGISILPTFSINIDELKRIKKASMEEFNRKSVNSLFEEIVTMADILRAYKDYASLGYLVYKLADMKVPSENMEEYIKCKSTISTIMEKISLEVREDVIKLFK